MVIVLKARFLKKSGFFYTAVFILIADYIFSIFEYGNNNNKNS
jgi:hypothetical protein